MDCFICSKQVATDLILLIIKWVKLEVDANDDSKCYDVYLSKVDSH